MGLQQRRGLATDPDVEGQGYIRMQPVDLDNTGLEQLLATDSDPNSDGSDVWSENMMDMNTTMKEAEWLAKVTDMDMAMVINQCPQLVYLQVSGCTQIGDATVYALASAPSMPSAFGVIGRGRAGGMQGLWLDLTRHISSVAWMTFIHAEQKRRSISPESSFVITGSDGGTACQQHLHHLDLSYCGFVTDACLINSLPLWTESLTHLRLCSLYNVTDETVLAIAEHCPHLRLLHLSRCFKITNHSLIRLASSPLTSNLIYLSLAFLNQVNEQGIKHLVYACQQLRTLDISGAGINPMFKQVIIRQWDQWREQKQWGKIDYHEEPVLLL
jgi:anti-anti-sigma regulatory factor